MLLQPLELAVRNIEDDGVRDTGSEADGVCADEKAAWGLFMESLVGAARRRLGCVRDGSS